MGNGQRASNAVVELVDEKGRVVQATRSNETGQAHSARSHAPANLREPLIRAHQRRKVRGVVEIERRICEPNDPPARRSAPRPRE